METNWKLTKILSDGSISGEEGSLDFMQIMYLLVFILSQLDVLKALDINRCKRFEEI